MKYYWCRINWRQLFVDFFILSLLLIGTSFAFIDSAHATAGGEGDNTSCNGVGNPNSPCVPGQGGSGGSGGNGGNGGSGGTSNSHNTNTNLNGNSNNNSNVATGGTGIGLGGTGIASAGSTVTTNTSAVALGQGGSAKGGNANSNAQGGNSDQHQLQTQLATSNSNSQGGTVNGSGNGGVSNVEVTNKPAAATASAVPVTVVQSDSCSVGYAAGGQAVSFGLSFSGTRTDENCERIKLWRELRAAGYQKEALLLLMQDDRVAKAFAGNKKQAQSDTVRLSEAQPLRGNNNEYEGREIANLR